MAKHGEIITEDLVVPLAHNFTVDIAALTSFDRILWKHDRILTALVISLSSFVGDISQELNFIDATNLDSGRS